MADLDDLGADELIDESEDYDWPVNVYVGYGLAFAAAGLFCFLGAYLNFFFNDDGKVDLGPFKISATIFCAAIGFFGGFLVFWATGFPVVGIKSPMLYHLEVFKSKKMPAWGEGRVSVVGFQPFDLYLTVHRVQNMFNDQDIFGFTSGNNLRLFVEIRVGRKMHGIDDLFITKNTIKRTCINPAGCFEEIFHFNCKPTDDTLRITVKDQDIFQENELGSCDINITKNIINLGFPQKRAFKLNSPGSHAARTSSKANASAGTVVVSFAPGQSFSAGAISKIKSKNEFAIGSMTQTQKSLLDKTNSKSYGHFGTFNEQK
jgi:hypothetical protein